MPGKAQQLSREVVHVREELERLTPQWEAAASKLTEMTEAPAEERS